MKKSFLILVLFVTFGFQCEQECTTFVSREYELDLRNLVQKQYSLNDSIIVFKDIDSKLLLKNGDLFDNSNMSINFSLILLKIRSDFGAIDSGYVYFDADLKNSSVNEISSLKDDVVRKYSLNCNDLSCSFNLTLIPKAKGIYCLGFIDLGNFGNFSECEDNKLTCLISDGNNNYHDLVKSPYPRMWVDTKRTRISIENPASRNDLYFFEVK
ncbi:MAG TPA: hypothetical protein VK169_18815 [Saprospiraceae bacterium]|nr:hypothetical protein [Saprospiraceae bacterium]